MTVQKRRLCNIYLCASDVLINLPFNIQVDVLQCQSRISDLQMKDTHTPPMSLVVTLQNCNTDVLYLKMGRITSYPDWEFRLLGPPYLVMGIGGQFIWR
jgi:hypothetical protein